MTIYIPMFWCGVIATLVAEIITAIVFAMIPADSKSARRKGDKR